MTKRLTIGVADMTLVRNAIKADAPLPVDPIVKELTDLDNPIHTTNETVKQRYRN